MQDTAGDFVKGQPSEVVRVGDFRLDHSAPMQRTAHVLAEIAAGRAVSDPEIRQHAMDCAWLMEQAYARFERFGDESGREEAIRWNVRRGEALKALSPAWKAAREAAIFEAIGGPAA